MDTQENITKHIEYEFSAEKVLFAEKGEYTVEFDNSLSYGEKFAFSMMKGDENNFDVFCLQLSDIINARLSIRLNTSFLGEKVKIEIIEIDGDFDDLKFSACVSITPTD